MNNKLFLKIASDLYTYLKEADQDEQDLNISFKQLKTDILGKRDQITSNKIKALKSTMNPNDFIEFINQSDSKGYTLLMLAASNNLIKTVKELILTGVVDTSKTVKINGNLFNKILNYKIKKQNISEEQIDQLKSQKEYDAMAIDIAKIKGYNEIVNILK